MDSDENSIRRSSRANKGKNSKLEESRKLEEELALSINSKHHKNSLSPDNIRDAPEMTLSKKRSESADTEDRENTKKLRSQDPESKNETISLSADVANEDSEASYEEVRCLVCGTVDGNFDEDSDKGGTMIECETCLTWQHAKCMLGHANKRKFPKVYKCELCSDKKEHPKIKHELAPEVYFKNLKGQNLSTRVPNVARFLTCVPAIKNTKEGEKGENNEEDEGNSKDEVDSGENRETSDEEYFEEDNFEKNQAVQEKGEGIVEMNQNDTAIRATYKGSSRKNSKLENTITIKKTTKERRPDKKPNDTKVRDGVREQFKKVYILTFIPEIPNLPEKKPEQIEKEALKWSGELEQLLYDYYNEPTNKSDPGLKYRERFRNLFAALKDKKNIKLRQRLISNDMSLVELIVLKNEELINPDMQKFREDSIRKNIAASTLKVPTIMPRVKKTHKGDEVIEDEGDIFVENESLYFGRGSIDESAKNKDNQTKGQEDEHVENDNGNGNSDKENSSEKSNSKSVTPTSRTKSVLHSISVPKQESNTPDVPINVNFAYNDVPDSKIMDIDDTGLDKIFGSDSQEKEQSNDNGGKIDGNNNVRNDNANNDDNDDDAYSPSQQQDLFSSDEQVDYSTPVWRGNVQFVELPSLSADMTFSGHSEGSISSSFETSYTLLDVNQYLVLEGRLDKVRAETYLNQIMSTRNLIVMELQSLSSNYHAYQKLFEYFKSKSRYGVLKNKKHYVKDIYLVPIDCTSKKELPHFLQNLHTFNYDYSGVSKLFIVFTVKKDYTPDADVVQNVKNQLQKPLHDDHDEYDPNYDLSTASQEPNAPTSQNSRIKNDLGATIADSGNSFLGTLISTLSPQQVQLLEEIVMQNPEVRQNPNKLVEIISFYVSSANGGNGQ